MLRHLEFERTDEMCEKLDEFLEENVGKKYDFPLMKVATQRKTQIGKSKETFFCSELIAKCFKVCGIMDNVESACSRFFPSDFSEKGCTIPFGDMIEAHPEKTLLLCDIDEKSTLKTASEVEFFNQYGGGDEEEEKKEEYSQ